MTVALYLAKVLLSSVILYGYYRLFLRNKQFHHYNRFYLLSALFVSILLPFIKIPVLYKPGNAVNEAVYQTIDVLTVNNWEAETPPVAANTFSQLFTLENALYLLYIAGVAILLVLLAKSLFYINRIRKKYTGESIDHLKFYNTKEPGTPFSFFRSIFWNEQLSFNSREGQQIFRHELFHVQQKHSADILLAEVITALFWYNPVFHLIKKEIKAIHEFLADQYAASGNDRYAYAELLVQQTLEARRLSGVNHFFQNHIKRRIAMITQFQQSRYGYWSRVMILPVSVILFCAFALYTQKPAARNADELQSATESITILVDPGHGGIDNGAKSYDEQLNEKDIALQISRQMQQLAPQYKVNVLLTREGDYLPGNATTIQEGLKSRTDLVQQVKADLLISIHVSAAPKIKKGNDLVPNPSSGFEVYITNKTESTLEPSRKLGISILNAISGLYTTKPSLIQRKEQGIWVLDKAACPAVIVECGFITNDKDVAFVTNPGNQQLIAKKLLEAVVAWKNNPATALQQPVPVQQAIAVVNLPLTITQKDTTKPVYLALLKNAGPQRVYTASVYVPGTYEPVYVPFDTVPKKIDRKDSVIYIETKINEIVQKSIHNQAVQNINKNVHQQQIQNVNQNIQIISRQNVNKNVQHEVIQNINKNIQNQNNQNQIQNNKKIIRDTVRIIRDTVPAKKQDKDAVKLLPEQKIQLQYKPLVTYTATFNVANLYKPDSIMLKQFTVTGINKAQLKIYRPLLKYDIKVTNPKPVYHQPTDLLKPFKNKAGKPISVLSSETDEIRS